ncbi:MAG: hypothetical protein KAH95_01020 [Spirochaetales bacterium]|nr:hypothetical protein [Spirochaetales bacterium]
MKPKHRILLSIYITFVVYSTISMIWGPSGLVQTSKLSNYKEKLVQNTSELSLISSKLILQSNRLRTDQDLIALKARDLGYFDLGEGEIILKGYNQKNTNLSVGSYFKKFDIKTTNINYIRIISSIAGLICYLILTSLHKKMQLNSRRL